VKVRYCKAPTRPGSHQSAKLQFPVLVPRHNIVMLLILWLSAIGSDSSFMSFMFHSRRLHLSSMTFVVYMAANPVHHRRTKHIEIGIHFVREKWH
jgi:hypothetical protein